MQLSLEGNGSVNNLALFARSLILREESKLIPSILKLSLESSDKKGSFNLPQFISWDNLRKLTLKDIDASALSYFKSRAPMLQEIVLRGLLKKEGNWLKEVSIAAGGRLELVDIRSLGAKDVEVVTSDEERKVIVVGKGGMKKVRSKAKEGAN